MPRQRVLITVKTYPTLSQKYGETVCTAGVREDGTWVRIYPVPFRRLDDTEQYKKFDWIDCELVRSTKDPRPETHHPADPATLVAVGHIDTRDEWRERRELLLQKCKVHSSVAELICLRKQCSLAILKPYRILDFVWEEEEREWDQKKIETMRSMAAQGDLFNEEAWRQNFRVIPKLPYNFSYRFIDSDGKKRELQVLDWEVGALFWNCLRKAGGDEAVALRKVKDRYLNDYATKDLHFFLGTTHQWHNIAVNPWVIIGVLGIPHQNQLRLF